MGGAAAGRTVASPDSTAISRPLVLLPSELKRSLGRAFEPTARGLGGGWPMDIRRAACGRAYAP